MLADAIDEHQFDVSVLPFSIIEGVTVEDVSPMLQNSFDWLQGEIGRYDLRDLKSVRYAIVHRYKTDSPDSSEADERSDNLLHNIAACLRIIRPMRQIALLMRGELRDNGALDVKYFDHPINLLQVPEVQKLFHLRNSDLELLRSVAPYFLGGMKGEFRKFRMAVEFHESGHFDHWYWKARYSLWCSATEALFTSLGKEHMGSLVATERIKWFLGTDTSIYEPGDIPPFFPQAQFTVGDVVGDAYKLRNSIAHGGRTPDYFFEDTRPGGDGRFLKRVDVLLEAVSFVVRKSLLRILQDKLLNHFANNNAAIAYFSAAGLVRSKLQK
jgi:hypothetical protein